MRSCCRLLAVLFLSLSALASELTVRVVDPQSAAVSGAQVEIFPAHSSDPLAALNTSAQGLAPFRNLTSAVSRVHVLAPGFAEQWQSLESGQAGENSTVTITLHL